MNSDEMEDQKEIYIQKIRRKLVENCEKIKLIRRNVSDLEWPF